MLLAVRVSQILSFRERQRTENWNYSSRVLDVCRDVCQTCSGEKQLLVWLILWQEEKPSLIWQNRRKKVVVVGGGPGGLYAAYVCALLGHDVTLYEEKEMLGGNMRLAAYPPGKGDITNMIRSYIQRCQKDGVEIKLNHEVTADFIKEENPDSVILATAPGHWYCRSKASIIRPLFTDQICWKESVQQVRSTGSRRRNGWL